MEIYFYDLMSGNLTVFRQSDDQSVVSLNWDINYRKFIEISCFEYGKVVSGA